MQTRPARWASLWDADGTWMELRLTLDNVQYGNDHIAAGGASVTHYLYDSYSIGNACAGKLTVKLLEPQSIARGIREAKLECRLVSEDGGTSSNWLAQGTWYLDKVEHNADGSARLEFYDALALTDVYLYDRGAVPASASWPKTATAGVQLECDRCGVPRPASYTAFSSVQVPAPEGLTCREILQSIAAVAGGNFTMGKDGKLRFVPLKGLGVYANSDFTMGVADYRRTSDRRTVTGLLLKGYDDSYSYGSDSFEVPGECAWADATVGNTAYYAIRALAYQGYKASGCYIDPLAELGDQAAIADSADCMMLDDFTLTYGEGLWGSCSAPLRDEVEERIKRANASERKVNRLALRTQANSAAIDTMATSEYVSDLLGRMNAQANAQGGYTYITQGEGLRTYDVPVSDPLVGAEAAYVTEVKGGTIRIANSRNEDGTWKWLTVFESGHIASELVTAVNIVAGFIGSPSGNYWNLDTGEMRLASTATVDGKTLAEYIAENSEIDPSELVLTQQQVFNSLTEDGVVPGLFMQDGTFYINADYLKTGVISDGPGFNRWNLKTGEFSLSYIGDTPTVDVLRRINASGGGTNLLMDTNVPMLTKVAADADRYWSRDPEANVTNSILAVSGEDRPTGGIDYMLQMAFSGANAGKKSGLCFYKDKAGRLIDGQEYTLSCWAKSSGGAGAVVFQYGQTKYVASAEIAVSQKWRQYSWTFTFDQSRAGGSGGARIYFLATPTTSTASTIQVCGMQLETGGIATDWSESVEDARYAIARVEANAKEFTNSVSKSDREYAKKERDDLDKSFSQEKVFNRLTANGVRKGIILDKNGELYLNATYIKSGVLDAGLIKTGLITDETKSKGWTSKWNLKNGRIDTKSLYISNGEVNGSLKCITNAGGHRHWVDISNGAMNFWAYDSRKKKNKKMLQIYPQRYAAQITSPSIYLDVKQLQVKGKNGWCGDGLTKKVKVASGIKKSGSTYKLTYKTFEFINGILVDVI